VARVARTSIAAGRQFHLVWAAKKATPNQIRVIRIMELITDNFSRRLHAPDTITRFRRDLTFTIAADFGRTVKISSAAISSRVACMRDQQLTFR
jgi:hypothetical protein